MTWTRASQIDKTALAHRAAFIWPHRAHQELDPLDVTPSLVHMFGQGLFASHLQFRHDHGPNRKDVVAGNFKIDVHQMCIKWGGAMIIWEEYIIKQMIPNDHVGGSLICQICHISCWDSWKTFEQFWIYKWYPTTLHSSAIVYESTPSFSNSFWFAAVLNNCLKTCGRSLGALPSTNRSGVKMLRRWSLRAFDWSFSSAHRLIWHLTFGEHQGR